MFMSGWLVGWKEGKKEEGWSATGGFPRMNDLVRVLD